MSTASVAPVRARHRPGAVRQNMEYEAKRESQRLGPPVVKRVAAGSYQELRQQRVAEGAPEAQVKIPQLSPNMRFGDQLTVLDEITAGDEVLV